MSMTDDQRSFLQRVLKNNMAAVYYCEMLFGVSQVWDDIVDADKPLTSTAVNAAFWDALITIPNNAFYQQHFHVLNPLMSSCIQDWMDATRMERSSDEHLAASYVLRDSLSNIVIHCARLIGGFSWAQSISLDVRYAVYDESLEEYKAGHSDG
jgi:hypothetical protein